MTRLESDYYAYMEYDPEHSKAGLAHYVPLFARGPEVSLGALEDAPPAVAHATGMAAIVSLLLATCAAGDEIVACDVAYGGTVRLPRIVNRWPSVIAEPPAAGANRRSPASGT